MSFSNLRAFLKVLKDRKDLKEIAAPVDPYLELAEIHRRVVETQGPALLFRNVKGSSYPVVTNLFGTKERVDLAFGDDGRKFVEEAAKLPEELLPPSLSRLWQKRNFFRRSLSLGVKTVSTEFVRETPTDLDTLPIITSWKEDGGPFLTLPLVYTEHPETRIHNLGIYRMQKFSKTTTGMHMQIGKGGGFHLSAAKKLGKNLPVNVFLGGPPAAIVAAIAPLPENVPELILASLLQRSKIHLSKRLENSLPALAEAEFVLVGSVDPNEYQPEGPFGDHYGYYSLTHDFPVFRCATVLRRKDAIFPATVVGKPRQEDYYIGNYLQELLSPLFPLVMPAVRDLWSYGETGFHSLTAAYVHERYTREAMSSAFRILGEGQLSLTKILFLVDKPLNLRNFPQVLEYILERADFSTDLFVFSNLSMDTLDYCGPRINEGSKAVLIGMGQPMRTLPRSEPAEMPTFITKMRVFCPGCLVVSGASYVSNNKLAQTIADSLTFDDWPLIILVDDAVSAASSSSSFLWTVFTRFEPAADIYCRILETKRFHPALTPPVVIDSRMKPSYPDELFCDEKTKKLVDSRWLEYFK